jgi:hypothetical protein
VNPGRGPTWGGNNSVISVIMLRTTFFPRQFLIGYEVAVCHIHCSLRIHVDGHNNFSILSNRMRCHFIPRFVVYPVLVIGVWYIIVVVL